MQLELLSQPETPASELVFTSKRIPDSVLSILKFQIEIKAASQGFSLDAPQMERKQYEAFKEIVESLKGKWTGKTHLFPYNPEHLLSQIVEDGRFPDRNPHALFETPESAVEDLLDFIDLPTDNKWFTHSDLRLLEPNAGMGAIARKLRENLPHCKLDCVELDPYNREILVSQGFNLIASDFLKYTPSAAPYDFVVMNPPFKGLEFIEHVYKAFSLLKPNGRLGAIVPTSFLWRSDKKSRAFRNFIAERGYWEESGATFEGTPIKTLFIRIENFSQEYLNSQWLPSSGYDSRYHEALEIALDSDRDWHNIIMEATQKPESMRASFIGDACDRAVERLIKDESCCFYYDNKVKQQLVKSQLEYVAEFE